MRTKVVDISRYRRDITAMSEMPTPYRVGNVIYINFSKMISYTPQAPYASHGQKLPQNVVPLRKEPTEPKEDFLPP
jgi:hypothetical protein